MTDVEKRTCELENSVAFISGSMHEIEKDDGIPRIKSDLNAVATKTIELEHLYPSQWIGWTRRPINFSWMFGDMKK